jgi:hypothetical protein
MWNETGETRRDAGDVHSAFLNRVSEVRFLPGALTKCRVPGDDGDDLRPLGARGARFMCSG